MNIVVVNSLGELYQKLKSDIETISRENYNNLFDFIRTVEFSINDGCNCSIYRLQSEQLYKSFGSLLIVSEQEYFRRLFSADQVWVYWEGTLLYKV